MLRLRGVAAAVRINIRRKLRNSLVALLLSNDIALRVTARSASARLSAPISAGFPAGECPAATQLRFVTIDVICPERTLVSSSSSSAPLHRTQRQNGVQYPPSE
jgi:hypothetical protein